MDRDRGTEGPGEGRKSGRTAWIRCALAALLLAAFSACAGASPPGPGYGTPPQDSLAAVIRGLRAGEDADAVVDAVAAAARIAPESLDGALRDAMTHALALSINAEDSTLAALGSVFEEALAAVWSQDELEATMREIPSEMGLPTARQTVAARLVGRLEAGQAGDDLLAAMAEAFTSIGSDHYPMYGIRNEVAAAWAKHHSAEELAGFIRSIVTGAERTEQAAAAFVLDDGRHWRTPPAGMDSTGVTDSGLRAALAEALAHTNGIENSRERERNRLEAIGDRAGLDSLWAEERGRWQSRNLRLTLAWVVWGMRDPATITLLADARGVGHSLSVFGGPAVSHILAALTGESAYLRQITELLSDLVRLARDDEIPEGSAGAVATAVQGFLSGETLRDMQIADPEGFVLSGAIDLAVALGDADALRMVHSLAADPVEMVRVGVAARNADVLVADVRLKIDWTPPARSQAEIAAELRTVPLSSRETLAQIEAARLASQIESELVSDALRSVVIEALDHTRRAGANPNDWYRVQSALADWLFTGFTPASAIAAIRAVGEGRYGAEQALAVEFARRLRGDAGEDLRLAVIAALEHVNSVNVDEQSWSTSSVVALQRDLAYAVGALEDPRGIPAIARSGWGFSCNTHMAGDFSIDIARAILAALAEPDPPTRRVSAGLGDLAVLLVGNDRTRDIPDELVAEIVAAARGYLDGTAMEGFSTTGSSLRRGIVRSAIFLAAVVDEPELVALADGLAADPAAVAALGVTDPEHIESLRDYARERLAERPILTLGDC